MAKIDLFIGALQNAGYRLTEQRRAICAYLAATSSHPTAYEVYAAIAVSHPEISRATVYNTLNALQQLGAIVEIGSGTGHTRYETDSHPHINLICLRCHTIEDYEGPLPGEGQLEASVAQSGFQPVAMKVDLLGFCAECRLRKRMEIQALWRTQQQDELGNATTKGR
jgi:Fur family transcriptional regulator, peroxide stress response regulator